MLQIYVSSLQLIALNSPSLIFFLYKSETESPGLELANFLITLHNILHIIQLYNLI